MSRVFDAYFFSGNYERDEALRIRQMEEEHEWFEMDQANAESQQPSQRFVLADGTVIEETAMTVGLCATVTPADRKNKS